jgi:hypothetical protein
VVYIFQEQVIAELVQAFSYLWAVKSDREVAELAVEQHQAIRFYPTFQGLLALLIVVVVLVV